MIKHTFRALLLSSLLLFGCGKESSSGEEFSPEISSPPTGTDTYGYIKTTSGTPIEGVVVTDGFTTTTTDEDGLFAMSRSDEASFIYYSIPSGYEVNIEEPYNVPTFFTVCTESQSRYDFTLTPLSSSEDSFELICIGDPQVGEGADVVRFKNEIVSDILAYSKTVDVPCYAMTLGDIVDNVWSLYPNMVVALDPSNVGMPVFQTIGNHDHEYPTANDKASRATYESYFGPSNYSFNRGKVHIVSMDDVQHGAAYSSGYEGGFTDEQYQWLIEDLSYVDKDYMVILCVHIPFRGGGASGSSSSVNTDKYYSEMLNELSKFEYATILAGHTHTNINWEHTNNGKEIFEHVVGTACGAWWKSTVCGDGTPNGYAIMRIEGNTIKEWVYKAAQHDEDFQIRLYKSSDTFTAGVSSGVAYQFSSPSSNRIVANIWNYDSKWSVKIYENDVYSGDMVKYSDRDAWVSAYHMGVLNWSLASSTDHLWYYTLKSSTSSVRVEATDRFGNVYTQSMYVDPTSSPAVFHDNY